MKKAFKIIALIFLISFSLDFLVTLFLGFSAFYKSASDSWNRPSYNDLDTTYQYREKIDHYTYLLDSLLEVNPKQAELFAIKLKEKFKGEREFSKYKVYALMNQDRFDESIIELKRLYSNKYADDYNQIEFDLAICYENTEQYDSAIYYYKKSDLENNLYRIFWSFEKQSKNDSAIHYLEKIEKNLKKDPNVLNNLKEIDFVNRKLDSLKKALN